MNKWVVDEHKRWSEKVRIKSPLLSALDRQKQKLWRNQIKENRSLSPWGWMVPIFNDTLFVSFTAIITARNGWDGTNFDIGNRMVGSIKMSRNRLVKIIVPYGTKVFSKSRSGWRRYRCKICNIYCKKCSKCYDVGGGACKIVPKLDLGPEMDMAELRNEHV